MYSIKKKRTQLRWPKSAVCYEATPTSSSSTRFLRFAAFSSTCGRMELSYQSMRIYHQAREAVSDSAGELCLLETTFVASCEANLSLKFYGRVQMR